MTIRQRVSIAVLLQVMSLPFLDAATLAAEDAQQAETTVHLSMAIEEQALPGATGGETRGLAVTMIGEDGVAYRAGIRVGDIILLYNGEEVSQPARLVELVKATRAGSVVPIVLLRGAVRLSLQARF